MYYCNLASGASPKVRSVEMYASLGWKERDLQKLLYKKLDKVIQEEEMIMIAKSSLARKARFDGDRREGRFMDFRVKSLGI